LVFQANALLEIFLHNVMGRTTRWNTLACVGINQPQIFRVGVGPRNIPFVLAFALIPSANSFLVGYISFHPPYALLAPYSGVEAKDMSLGRLADVGQSTLVIALKIVGAFN